MLLQEKDHPAFKRWILPKLETISDVDAEVLADYVVALVTTNETEADVKRNCVEQLSEFLTEDTEPIVHDVLSALKDKSFLSGTRSTLKATASEFKPVQDASQPAPIPSIVGTTNHKYELHPSRVTRSPPLNAPRGPAASRPAYSTHRLPDQSTWAASASQEGANASRKRKLLDRERSQSREAYDAARQNRYGVGPRPSKQMMHKEGGSSAINFGSSHIGSAVPTSMPHLPPPPPGPLSFDPSNPMAFLAMAAAFGVNLSGMPSILGAPPTEIDMGGSSQKKRCEDYYNKGFCALGSFCPFEHGNPIEIPVDEVPAYDPEQAFLAAQPEERPKKKFNAHSQSRNHRGVQRHADFSQTGPTYDTSNTTLVVEQIPRSHCSEEQIRAHFSEFGTIVSVQIHEHRHVAIIEFEDRKTANRAYMSPKAIFENRFVKVYWYKRDLQPVLFQGGNGNVDLDNSHVAEEPLNMEEFIKRQAEAQKTFEERRKKEQAAAAHAEEIEKKLETVNEEIRKVKLELAALSGDKEIDEEFSQSLANLQAEAEVLFAQHKPHDYNDSTGFRGRGNFRGRYQSRGHSHFASHIGGNAPFRGSYRARGQYGASVPNNRSSVKRLDNRPRRLAVAHIEVDSAKDEALRQHLLNVPDCTSIERHPEQADTLIITFNERYQAEMFLDASLDLPDVGKLELSWVPNDAFGGISKPLSTLLSNSKAGNNEEDNDAATHDGSSATLEDGDVKLDPDAEAHTVAGEQDMDVADDVDEWL